MTKLIIFDLDGTLLDTVEDLANATNYALTKCGFKARKVEEYKILCGRGIYNLFKGALPKGQDNEDNVAKMTTLFLDYYNKHQSDCTKPYNGIENMLKTIDSHNIKIAIASNKYQAGVEALVARFFPYIQFVKILGQTEGRAIKPDPAIINQIMATDNTIYKEDVVYCGDSDVDMQTGINAQVKTIGVTWGFRTKEELEAYKPWKIVSNPTDICKALGL